MFKKGQLVQSIKYGDYYLIVRNATSVCHAEALPLSHKRWFSETMFVENNRFKLIGNNYKRRHANETDCCAKILVK